jgi:DNA polymerase V
MKAIVDCNSFYCSCERLFQPHLDYKPVVVLSNNDGCIISRSDEAKKLGVEMAGPYFKAKPLIEKYSVSTFSSNYNLYGDLSWRVMETLRIMLGKENVEVYSVDEAFLNLDEFAEKDLQQVALNIRETVELWTGIKVSVGVAPTKVLSKVANHLAKKNKIATACGGTGYKGKNCQSITGYTHWRSMGSRQAICTEVDRSECCVYRL